MVITEPRDESQGKTGELSQGVREALVTSKKGQANGLLERRGSLQAHSSLKEPWTQVAYLAGQAWAWQARRAPQCLTCSWGSVVLTAPRGSRVSSIPILAPGQDPESSCGVGRGRELRGEEERAYLVNASSASGFAWFVPRKPRHQGDPPCGPEFTCQGASPTDHSGREGGTG